MNRKDISLRIEPIANGFLLSAHATVDGSYGTAYTDRTFVSSRGAVIDDLVRLYESAEALRPEDAKDDF